MDLESGKLASCDQSDKGRKVSNEVVGFLRIIGEADGRLGVDATAASSKLSYLPARSNLDHQITIRRDLRLHYGCAPRIVGLVR